MLYNIIRLASLHAILANDKDYEALVKHINSLHNMTWTAKVPTEKHRLIPLSYMR